MARKFWAVGLLLGLAVAALQPGAGAEAPFGAVDARAGADALRVGVSVKKFLIVENFVDAGGPTAQSHLSSTGAESFAALPDPGGLVLNYNTFVGLATGSGLPFDYPFYAQAKYPGSPTQETGDPSGAFKVSARTAADGAEALAQMRPTAGDVAVSGALARAQVKLDSATVTATSETGADLVALAGGAVKLSDVTSRSVTTRKAGRSEPTTETALTVDLITVADKRIRYGRGGFELLGTPVPVPSDTVEAALREALKPLGVQIDVVHPQAVAGGMKAAVLEVRQAYPLPAGEGQLVLRFGGATSSITAEDALPAPGIGGAVGGGGGGGGGGAAGGSGPDAVTGTASAPSDTGAGGPAAPADSSTLGDIGASTLGRPTRTGTAPVSQPPLSSTVPTPYVAGAAGPSAAAVGAAPTPTGSAAPAMASSHRRSVAGPYGALVAGGLAVVLLSAFWARGSAAAALWLGQ